MSWFPLMLHAFYQIIRVSKIPLLYTISHWFSQKCSIALSRLAFRMPRESDYRTKKKLPEKWTREKSRSWERRRNQSTSLPAWHHPAQWALQRSDESKTATSLLSPRKETHYPLWQTLLPGYSMRFFKILFFFSSTHPHLNNACPLQEKTHMR